MNVSDIITINPSLKSASIKGEKGTPVKVDCNLTGCAKAQLDEMVKRTLSILVCDVLRDNAALVGDSKSDEYRMALINLINEMPDEIDFAEWYEANRIVKSGKGGRKATATEKALRKGLLERGIDPDSDEGLGLVDDFFKNLGK